MEKTKEKKASFYAVNIVLYPTSSQYPERYIEVLTEAFKNKQTVVTHTDKATRIRRMYNDKGIIKGIFANFSFTDPTKPGINLNTNEPIVLENIDLSTASNLKDWDFYFFPNKHQFLFPKKTGVSKPQIIKFLKSALIPYLKEGESLDINVITNKDTIERIVSSQEVTSLHVTISYTNNDNLDDWEDLIDQDFRDSDTKHYTMTASATKSSPIKLAASKLLKAFIEISRKYGKTKATILENNRLIPINTDDHPEVVNVTYSENEDVVIPLQKIVDKGI